jgi:putative FmdB family regulatory protein
VPTYQYTCTACSEPLEAVQSFSDAPLTDCPACGGALRKVFSAVGVVFKGSGFYKNDSRSGGSTGGDKKTDGGKADGSTKTDPAGKTGKTDSSPKTDTASSTPASTPSTPAAKTA